MLARRGFPSPHPPLWQLRIITFQRQPPENWVGELYCTSAGRRRTSSQHFRTKNEKRVLHRVAENEDIPVLGYR